MQAELFKKIDVFQREWDDRAVGLIAESERVAGRKFFRKEYSVALTLCKWTPMGDPAFIVSARPYLGSERLDRNMKLPGRMSMFVAMSHHELLHGLVDNIISLDFFSSSRLIQKYKNESANVLSHLHLMAIQKAANERTKDNDLALATEELYAYIGGDYQTAWDIVSKEGVEPFLVELQAYNTKH